MHKLKNEIIENIKNQFIGNEKDKYISAAKKTFLKTFNGFFRCLTDCSYALL